VLASMWQTNMSRRIASGVGALVALAFLAGIAVSQGVVNLNPSGKECWSAAQGPGGPSQWLCINTVRNTSTAATTSGSGAATYTLTTDIATVIWTGTAPTTFGVTLPANAPQGFIATVGTNTTLTSMVTVTAPAGTTLSASYSSQTLTAPASVSWQLVGTVWQRIR
jgi:hypothetical protein